MKVLVHGRRADFPEAPEEVSFCEEPAGCSCQADTDTWETMLLTKMADERTIPGER